MVAAVIMSITPASVGEWKFDLWRAERLHPGQEDRLGGLPPPYPLPWLSPQRDDSGSVVVATPSSFLCASHSILGDQGVAALLELHAHCPDYDNCGPKSQWCRLTIDLL